MADVERSVQFAQVVPRLERVVASRVHHCRVDVYIGMIPRIGVSADFAEVVAVGYGCGSRSATRRPVVKSAFAARFVANLFRRLATPHRPQRWHRCSPRSPHASPLRILRSHLDAMRGPRSGSEPLATSPMPAILTRSCIREAEGQRSSPRQGAAPRRRMDAVYKTRSAEIGPGDVLVLVSDGLTEGGRLQDPYGYRFTPSSKTRL